MNFKSGLRNAVTSAYIYTQTFVPTFGPTTATKIAEAIAPIAAATVFSSCGDNEDNPIEKKETPPTITVYQSNIDITWWKKVYINWNNLYIWDIKVASRSENCEVSLYINWELISDWKNIEKTCTLTLKVRNNAWVKEQNFQLTEQSNKSNEEKIKSRLENLKNIPFQVGEEVNLLKWLEWINYEKAQVVIEWETYDIDLSHCVMPKRGNGYIILTVNEKWNTKQYKSESFNIKRMEINLPRVSTTFNGQKYLWINITSWDLDGWKSMEKFWIPEIMVVIENNKKYWTNTHSPEEIQKSRERLHISIMWEDDPSHLDKIKYILKTMEPSRDINILSPYWESIEELYKNQPNNSINIIVIPSSTYNLSKESYNKTKKLLNFDKYLNNTNTLIIASSGDVHTWSDDNKRNKIAHENNELDKHSWYSVPQSQFDKNNNGLLVVWTSPTWKANRNKNDWSYKDQWSWYPVWFSEETVVGWHSFPLPTWQWHYYEDHNFWSSYASGEVGGILGLNFGVYPYYLNANQLKKSSKQSSIKEEIQMDWKTQNISTPSPALFFINTYNIPNLIPDKIWKWQTITIKPEYKWTIPLIPWIRINWILYDEKNESIIKSINPFTDNVTYTLSYEDIAKIFKSGDKVPYEIISTNYNWEKLEPLTYEGFMTVE